MTAIYCQRCQRVHEVRRPQAYHVEPESRLMLALAVIGEVIGMAVLLLVLFVGIPFVLLMLGQQP